LKTDSDFSGTSTERAEKKKLKESNIFLMKVIHGRVPTELLNSKITSTDRENLSSLVPHLRQTTNTADEQMVMTYQDVYEEV